MSKREPVAWMYSDDHERMTTNETFCTVYSVKVGSPTQGVTDVPLYTAPTPLTDEQTTAIVQSVVAQSHRPIGMVEYGKLVARAVELAYGIGEE